MCFGDQMYPHNSIVHNVTLEVGDKLSHWRVGEVDLVGAYLVYSYMGTFIETTFLFKLFIISIQIYC